jgi:hypothetical protein
MTASDEKWLSFYRETDPAKRLALLNRLLEDDPGEEGELRRELFEHRYRHSGTRFRADQGMLACLRLLDLGKKSLISRREAEKAIRECLDLLGISRYHGRGDAAERALYWELRNTFLRYLETCRGENYSRKWFGLLKSSDTEKAERAMRELWDMTHGIARLIRAQDLAGFTEMAGLLEKAGDDAFFSLGDREIEQYAAFLRKRENG